MSFIRSNKELPCVCQVCKVVRGYLVELALVPVGEGGLLGVGGLFGAGGVEAVGVAGGVVTAGGDVEEEAEEEAVEPSTG